MTEDPEPLRSARPGRAVAAGDRRWSRGVYLGLLVAAIGLQLTAGAVSLRGLSHVVASSDLVTHSWQVISETDAYLVSLTEARAERRVVVLERTPASAGAYHRAVQRSRVRLAALRQLTRDNPAQQRRLDRLEIGVETLLAGMGRSVERALAAPVDREEEDRQVRWGVGEMARLRPLVREVRDAESGLLQQRQRVERASVRQNVVIVGGGTVISVALLGVLFALLTREIRDRQRAQAALQGEVAVREAAERASRTYADLARHVDVGLVVWRRRAGSDPAVFELVAANPRAEAIDPDRAYATRVGMTLAEVLDGAGARELAVAAGVVARTGSSLDLGERSIGAGRVLSVRAFPLPDGCVGVSYDDVTAQRAAADDLRRALAATERVNRELESFSYTVSHDLRAPLRGIDGFSLALLEEYSGVLDETGRDYLQRVRAGTQRMGALIDDLLALAKVTRSELRRVPVDLAAMVRELDAELRQTEPGRDVELVVSAEATVDADAALLRVAVENLLRNAWKFTSKRARARVEFGASALDGGQRAFFVRDDGAGFDPTHAGKLFGAFQRLHTAREFPGTGIGLATVQRIVTRHGGRVWADGGIDRGATFYFSL